MNSTSEPAIIPASNPAAAQRIFQAGAAGLALAAVAALWFSPVKDLPRLIAGIAVLILGCVPVLSWVRHSRPWFPCFEISMLTCVVFYAFPIIGGDEDLAPYRPDVLFTSALLVVGYLGAAVFCFNATRSRESAPAWASRPILPEAMLRYVPLGIVLNTAYNSLEIFGVYLSSDINGPIRSLCFGLGTVSAFIMACRWGGGTLSRQRKVLLVACLFLQIVCLFAQLYLIVGISLLVLCAIGYTTTRRTPPWMAILVLLPLIAILHNGKSRMREIYWPATGQQIIPGPAQLPAFFTQWIEFGLSKDLDSGQLAITQKLTQRASLFQMLALVVNAVPDYRPYIGGTSYKDIPAQIVPRFLWPNRPSSLMANQRLAVYFGLVDPDSPNSVSIAFGVLAEAYANFGALGILALGALTGFVFKHLALRSVGVPLFSAMGIFMILLTAWSFQAEQIMASWLTSLFQAAAICIGVPLLYKKFFGGI